MYPYFTRTVYNNGILGYVDYLDDAHLVKGNSIAVGMLSMKFFYMSHDFYAGQFTKSLYPKFEGFDNKVALWFIGWFNKSSEFFKSILIRNFESAFNKMELEVPFIEGKLAVSFISEHICELERECVQKREKEKMHEIKLYQNVASCKDLVISDFDKKVLASLSNRKLRKIKIDSLFNGYKGDVDLQKKDINGKGEYFVNSGIQNLGIKGRTDREAKVFPAGTLTIDFFGNCYYRPFPYKMATHNHVFSLESKFNNNEDIALYICGSTLYMQKIFSFNNMGTWPIIKEKYIYLPIKDGTGIIDWKFMQEYIISIKKVIICNLYRTISREKDAYLKAIK